MATNWDDDVDDIVIDDKPREDGLLIEDDPVTVPAHASYSALTKLEQNVTLILESLDKLADQQSVSGRAVEHRVSKAYSLLKDRLDKLFERVSGLEVRLDNCSPMVSAPQVDENLSASTKVVESSAAVEAVVSELVNAQFIPSAEQRVIEQLVFGKDLCDDYSLDSRRKELLDGVLAYEATAIGLAARLMLVRAAGAEELPSLLKEIGEAYYRRHPKMTDVTDHLEASLVKDLHKRIVSVGLRNSIELVCPGDRYDATRHVSPDRGVEVTAVRGWAVLRDNGKPLTKANVGLR